jgi:hypothetical protein
MLAKHPYLFMRPFAFVAMMSRVGDVGPDSPACRKTKGLLCRVMHRVVRCKHPTCQPGLVEPTHQLD